MKNTSAMSIASIIALAGMATAQPLVDGIFDEVTEGDLYGPIRWVNTVPTGFGDNVAGLFNGGRLRKPRDRQHRCRDLHREERPG